MLSHLSSKFALGDEEQTHEPRAALFLNRFTRSLTVMYATSGIEEIIGISSENMKGRSFYYCIQENCLDDAVRCLESAKGNDSIAYLRFRFRDPRRDDPPEETPSESEDDDMTDVTGSEDESDGDGTGQAGPSAPRAESSRSGPTSNSHNDSVSGSASRASEHSGAGRSPQSEVQEDIELEAVVSCTSDGLVVCLRRARPLIPGLPIPGPEPPNYGAIFAAPWAPQPMFQPALPQPLPYPLGAQHPAMQQAGPTPAFQNAFMQSIRDVAVFAWALTGINGCLAEYAKGTPQGDSAPPGGLPVWAPEQPQLRHHSTGSGYGSGTSSSGKSGNYPFGDPGLS
jgi:hypothetical protein